MAASTQIGYSYPNIIGMFLRTVRNGLSYGLSYSYEYQPGRRELVLVLYSYPPARTSTRTRTWLRYQEDGTCCLLIRHA